MDPVNTRPKGMSIAIGNNAKIDHEGKKIRLGDLGDFSLLLTSKGAEDADKIGRASCRERV